MIFSGIKASDYGLECLEVSDNGSGIDPLNFASLGLFPVMYFFKIVYWEFLLFYLHDREDHHHKRSYPLLTKHQPIKLHEFFKQISM